MKNIKNIVTKVLSNRRVIATLLIILGVGITIIYGIRTVRSYQQLQYIRAQGLDDGTADVDAIRPWMTIRYIGVAYGVPEEYIYAELDIPFGRRNRDHTLRQLNWHYQLGPSPQGDYPAIIDEAQQAILTYRQDPVVTGLDDIRPWMTIRYIANSTGVPEAFIFEQLSLPSEGNENKPLDLLSREVRYEGGPRALSNTIMDLLADYEAN